MQRIASHHDVSIDLRGDTGGAIQAGAEAGTCIAAAFTKTAIGKAIGQAPPENEVCFDAAEGGARREHTAIRL
ncbi:hypothetical protein D3C84_1101140 [compost metagenome]